MGVFSRSLRWLSLLLVAAIGLHELRYALEPGAGAAHLLAADAHSYLPLAATIVALVFGASLVNFVAALATARGSTLRLPERPRFALAWLAATAALVAMFVVQESFEGALLGGHMSGLHGLFGHGGWIALALAPALGALVALFQRGAHSAIAAVARRHFSRPSRRRTATGWPRLSSPSIRRPAALACHLAGRAPPHALP